MRCRRDFRPDTAISKDFEKKGVGEAAINDVDLADSGSQTFEAGVDFGNHPVRDDTLLDQRPAIIRREAFEEACGVMLVSEDSRRVGEEDELLGVEVARNRRGRCIGIDIECATIRLVNR